MTKSATREAADKVTFTQTEVTSAVALKAPIASPSFTGTVSGADDFISTKAGGVFLKNTSGGTSATQIMVSNTGGSMRAGVESSSGGTIQVGTLPYAAVFGNQGNYPTQFTTNGTARMTIDNGGKLTIPARAFEVGTFSSSGASAGVKHNIWGNNEIGIGSSVVSTAGQSHYAFYNPNGNVGYIQTSGSSTIYSTSSDYRLKENVTPMSGATAQTKLLKPCNFDWITGGNVNGFIAHELAEVVPEAVTGTKDAMRDEEYEVTPAVVDDEGVETTAAVMGTRSVPDMQGIDQAKLVPLLTATIQELIARIEALEGE